MGFAAWIKTDDDDDDNGNALNTCAHLDSNDSGSMLWGHVENFWSLNWDDSVLKEVIQRDQTRKIPWRRKFNYRIIYNSRSVWTDYALIKGTVCSRPDIISRHKPNGLHQHTTILVMGKYISRFDLNRYRFNSCCSFARPRCDFARTDVNANRFEQSANGASVNFPDLKIQKNFDYLK